MEKIFGLISIFALLVMVIFMGCEMDNKAKVVDERLNFKHPLKSLSLNGATEGEGIFIGIIGGYSSGEQIYYVFYAGNENGSYSLRRVPAEGVEIYEDATNESAYGKELRGGWNRWELHVPPETIAPGFNLDLSKLDK